MGKVSLGRFAGYPAPRICSSQPRSIQWVEESQQLQQLVAGAPIPTLLSGTFLG
jgi:hypothetical protein